MAVSEPSFVDVVAAALAAARGDGWDDLPDKVRADYRATALVACEAFIKVLEIRIQRQVNPDVLKRTADVCNTVVAWVRGWVSE